MIRKATIEDIQSIVKLEESVFPVSLGETFLYDELMLNPFAHYFVYEKDMEVIGYIGFRAPDETSEMMNFAVSPKAQGMKIGSNLLAYSINYLKQIGVKKIMLEVRKSNTKAQHLYEKFGFIQSYIRKNYYETEDAYVYIKEVS